ncbi:hypothetical protein B0H67DRAFT_647149 [Lasiosphaeris hirsuta]|uniref:Uncharacterized protein n=1 Tax=Lasiosphaeris hirsuta TaxID=260670 RepID=A0AA40DSH7_9PEZI|nr:hypothetical protein B0H67DRAFT_647149 [Lasiosphaeris hirsuta]
MAPEQRPPHANLADYAKKLQAEYDAEYLVNGEYHVRWGRETFLGIKEVIYRTVGRAKTPTTSGTEPLPTPSPYVGIDNGSI